MYNLLSNAVKFTPDGGSITLAAKLISDFGFRNSELKVEEKQPATCNPQSAIEVSVSDTGIGISHRDIDRIFNPFEQADGSSSREYQGTGLGLSLTKQLVELHGGRIWVESEGEGKGAIFSYIVPI